jgi:hypothetical protein
MQVDGLDENGNPIKKPEDAAAKAASPLPVAVEATATEAVQAQEGAIATEAAPASVPVAETTAAVPPPAPM